MDLTELQTAIQNYRAAPPAAVNFDWKSLLQLLPALISIFVPAGPLAAVITQVIQVILNIFVPASGAEFKAARTDHANGTGPGVALIASMQQPPVP